MPIAAGVVGASRKAAFITNVDVTTQEGGSADFDGAHGTMLITRHGSAVDPPILRAVLAENIGHFQGRPGHFCTGGSDRLDSESKGLDAAQMVLLETVV